MPYIPCRKRDVASKRQAAEDDAKEYLKGSRRDWNRQLETSLE